MRILAINTATDSLGVGIVRIPAGSAQSARPEVPAGSAESARLEVPAGPAESSRTEVLAELLLGPTPSRSGHSERLMPAIAWVAETVGVGPADLDGIAVVAGPGGFTGVRSGLAVAKSVAQARRIPVWGVDTLEALAAGYPGDGLISPLLDARRGEVFAALYRRTRDALKPLQEPILLPLADWLARLSAQYPHRVAFLGEGALQYPEPIAAFAGAIPIAPEAHLVRPATIARLAAPHLAAGGEDPLTLVPRYHRAPAMALQWVPNVGTKNW